MILLRYFEVYEEKNRFTILFPSKFRIRIMDSLLPLKKLLFLKGARGVYITNTRNSGVLAKSVQIVHAHLMSWPNAGHRRGPHLFTRVRGTEAERVKTKTSCKKSYILTLSDHGTSAIHAQSCLVPACRLLVLCSII